MGRLLGQVFKVRPYFLSTARKDGLLILKNKEITWVFVSLTSICLLKIAILIPLSKANTIR